VFLLGDAAHLTPPFIGQGLCAGVRDSMNLSWKIAGVLSDELPEPVLDTYEVERKPHALALITLARFVGVAMTQGGRTGDVLRRLIARRLHWLPGLRARVLDSETPPLCRSALGHRAGSRKSLPGRLCPNALVAEGIRYDEATGRGFVLVTGAPLPQAQRAQLADKGADVLEVGPGSVLHTWLADGNALAAVVRPDFTVMSAGRDIAALCDATPRFTP
jgi:3-(3-hydroxy-phenyl)propionate hydroxylase